MLQVLGHSFRIVATSEGWLLNLVCPPSMLQCCLFWGNFWISLCFEHSVGACMGRLWFVRVIDLYWNRLKKQAIHFPGTVQSELISAAVTLCLPTSEGRRGLAPSWDQLLCHTQFLWYHMVATSEGKGVSSGISYWSTHFMVVFATSEGKDFSSGTNTALLFPQGWNVCTPRE